MRELYQHIVRPLLFSLDAEIAHRLVARGLRVVHKSFWLRRRIATAPLPTSLSVHALGRTFSSPVGVAAGFDKDATMYNALGALGFSAVEVGTVTFEPQDGNPRPRLFRLPADRAIVNRMGFNNPGARAVADAIRAHPPEGLVLGINLGKSRTVPLDRAAEDYARSARMLGPLAHYLVINVSSPNTPGLRSLQSVDALRSIVVAVQRELAAIPSPPPLLVKLAPDLADEDIDAVADLAMELNLAGLIATNTTVARQGLKTPPERIARIGDGGLSGPPLRARVLEIVRRLYARSQGALTLVAVGGIENAQHAWEAIRAGATLVQLYTALVYQGPTVALDIQKGLAERLAQSGATCIADVVGVDAR